MMRGMAPRYWFPAKTHGWGWGMPRTWEGVVVLLAYCAAVTVPAFLFPDDRRVVVASVVVSTAVLLWVCVKKGEPAAWRWGKT